MGRPGCPATPRARTRGASTHTERALLPAVFFRFRAEELWAAGPRVLAAAGPRAGGQWEHTDCSQDALSSLPACPHLHPLKPRAPEDPKAVPAPPGGVLAPSVPTRRAIRDLSSCVMPPPCPSLLCPSSRGPENRQHAWTLGTLLTLQGCLGTWLGVGSHTHLLSY